MGLVELLWVPLSLIVGGASVLTLTIASLRPLRESSTQESATWYEDRAA